MTTETRPKLVGYAEVQRRLGFCRKTLFSRIKESGIPIYVDGRDRRQRLIDERDLPKLVETRERRTVAAYLKRQSALHMGWIPGERFNAKDCICGDSIPEPQSRAYPANGTPA